MQVKQEKHSYRDGDLEVRMAYWDSTISLRHRQAWGKQIQSTNIDHLVTLYAVGERDGEFLVESEQGVPFGFVEYKHENALKGDWEERYRLQFRTYKIMGDRCGVPSLCCFYRRKDFAMFVVPLNDIARKWFPENGWYSEQHYVSFLYVIRGIDPKKMPKDLGKTIPKQKRRSA